MSQFTLKNLADVEDAAAKHGMGDGFSARFAREDLGCVQTGFSLQELGPGKSTPFGHRHDAAEEVYVVLDGAGDMLLDDLVVPVERMDAVRVSPGVLRAFRAGDAGLSYIVFGPHHEKDGATTPVQWPTEGDADAASG
ncbi:MAG: cupin protein [Solirubrobacterales bacterium]|jgi:uncharacterized cupin superfamily protein|nr:cupin protein [Solirubrobacterales bacterium]